MIMNYFSLIDEIKQVSLRYSEEFYEGDIYEYLNSGNHKYPCIILTVQNITTDEDVNTISATIFAVDRLTNDSSNKLEVQSLCMSKITQILGTLEERVSSIQSNTLTPFTEKFSDLCGGMYGEFTLEYIGDGVCDEGLQYKEIELTNNGIYDIIGYDRAIVNVIPEIKLQDLTVTENNKEYLPADYGVDGFSKVTTDVEVVVKPLTPTYLNQTFQDYRGDIFSPKLIDTSNCYSMISTFAQFWKNGRGDKGDGIIDLSDWDTTNVNNMQSMFEQTGYGGAKFIIGGKFTTKNVNNFNFMFSYAIVPYPLEIDTSKGVNFQQFLYTSNHFTNKYDISALRFDSAVNMSHFFSYSSSVTNLIGEHTLEEVESGEVVLFANLKANCDLHWSPLDYKNMLACAKGVADLTGKTAATITLNKTQFDSFTEEQKSAIQSELHQKNWTLALA